jgi:hypothetical protein
VLGVVLLPRWGFLHADQWVLSTGGPWSFPPGGVTVRSRAAGVPPIVLPTLLLQCQLVGLLCVP